MVENGENGCIGEVGVVPCPNIGLATGSGLSSECVFPTATTTLFAPSSSGPIPVKSICVGGIFGTTFTLSGGSTGAGPLKNPGPSGGFDRLKPRLLLDPVAETWGSIGGGTGDGTPGEIAMSLGFGEISPERYSGLMAVI